MAAGAFRSRTGGARDGSDPRWPERDTAAARRVRRVQPRQLLGGRPLVVQVDAGERRQVGHRVGHDAHADGVAHDAVAVRVRPVGRGDDRRGHLLAVVAGRIHEDVDDPANARRLHQDTARVICGWSTTSNETSADAPAGSVAVTVTVPTAALSRVADRVSVAGVRVPEVADHDRVSANGWPSLVTVAVMVRFWPAGNWGRPSVLSLMRILPYCTVRVMTAGVWPPWWWQCARVWRRSRSNAPRACSTSKRTVCSSTSSSRRRPAKCLRTGWSAAPEPPA